MTIKAKVQYQLQSIINTVTLNSPKWITNINPGYPRLVCELCVLCRWRWVLWRTPARWLRIKPCSCAHWLRSAKHGRCRTSTRLPCAWTGWSTPPWTEDSLATRRYLHLSPCHPCFLDFCFFIYLSVIYPVSPTEPQNLFCTRMLAETVN